MQSAGGDWGKPIKKTGASKEQAPPKVSQETTQTTPGKCINSEKSIAIF